MKRLQNTSTVHQVTVPPLRLISTSQVGMFKYTENIQEQTNQLELCIIMFIKFEI